MILTDFAGADGFLSSIMKAYGFLENTSYHFYLDVETPFCAAGHWGSFIEIT